MIIIADDYSLLPHNTFRIPATAAEWMEFTMADDIPAVAARLRSSGKPHYTVGQGSNILFTGDKVDGTVIHSRILTMEADNPGSGRVRLTAGSGLNMDALIERTCQAGLWGLENLSLIPGEVGASAVQNVGAYGCEAGDIIESVLAFDLRTDRWVTLSHDDCRFAYRHSMFKEPENKGRFIIAEVTFMLSSEPKPRLEYGNLGEALADQSVLTPVKIREAVTAIRRTKLPDPDDTGSAGSYFTNPQVHAATFAAVEAKARLMFGPDTRVPHFLLPDGRVKIPAAWLIDRSGLKGSHVGGAGLWPAQPLVIANMSGHCTAADILALEHKVVDTVRGTFGVTLTPEVEKIPR